MESRTHERVEQWDSRPFSGGYDGLSELADGDFSGTVSVDGTWLFMLNGRVVGVIDGAIEDFERASGTVYEAPDPALPLLCAMEERGGETRAKYYTNETPLSEVDETLQNGSFTGYVKLSENVLSGDYYAVYYGGRRMAAAYIGSAERLVTGEEAFERADDEVGIYEVVDVEVEVTDVPDADASAGTAIGDESATADTTGSQSSDQYPGSAPTGIDDADHDAGTLEDDPTVEDVDVTDAAATDRSTAPADGTGADETGPNRHEAEDATAGPATASSSDGGDETDETDEATPRSSPSDGTSMPSAESEPADATGDSSEDGGVDQNAPDATSDDRGTASSAGEDASPALEEVEAAAAQLEQSDISWTDDEGDGSTGADDGETEVRFEEEEQWRETRSIPSIDPDNSASATGSSGPANANRSAPTPREGADTDQGAGSTTSSDHQSAPDRDGTERASSRSGPSGGTPASGPGEAVGAADDDAADRVAELTRRVEQLEAERDELASRAEQLEAERDELASRAEQLEAERDDLRATNEDLSSTVDRLESKIAQLKDELAEARSDAATGTTSTTIDRTELPAEKALSQTNLFVRYESKSEPTLETGHDGDADREEVAANLRLEHHTSFDADTAAVDGRPYEEFLTETMEYRFVDWLTEMVLYEIRDTGNAGGLGDLYDAIPRIDRVEFDAAISLADDDTEDVPDEVRFDVVAFDKMGEPLVVADLNDSREPAAQWMLEEMEENASAVKANYPTLAAATVVTSSFFEPGALEVAEQATSSGILSRGSKLSYVNLSRKTGYHLCLVESRDEGFHMNVPEL